MATTTSTNVASIRTPTIATARARARLISGPASVHPRFALSLIEMRRAGKRLHSVRHCLRHGHILVRRTLPVVGIRKGGGRVAGPVALVGSGEYTPAMLEVEGELLAGRPPRDVQIPTAAGRGRAPRLGDWGGLGRAPAGRPRAVAGAPGVRERRAGG